MKFLVTGAAGFIGFHTAQILLERGDEVVGLDNLNDYYDVTLKEARLAQLKQRPNFRFVKLDLADRSGMQELFAREKFARVIHLAAQAGVRYSLQNPLAYVDSNVVGFANVLEGCRHNGAEHLVYASTSSVYGANTKMPFSVHQNVDHPLSFYAATKKANELMAHTYAYLSRRTSWPANRSTSSTTAITAATSRSSTTSRRAWCTRRTASQLRMPPGTAMIPTRVPARRLTGCTTSATTSPSS
jgi:nucleoside-diphosphate-sugar epimerase